MLVTKLKKRLPRTVNKHKLLKHFFLPFSKLLSISLFAFLLHITGTNAFSLLLMTAFFAALHLRAQMASLVVTLLALQSCISFPFLKVFPVYGVLLWAWALFLGALIFYVKAPPLHFKKSTSPIPAEYVWPLLAVFPLLRMLFPGANRTVSKLQSLSNDLLRPCLILRSRNPAAIR